MSEFSGQQKVAALLLGIDRGLAATVLRSMGEDQVEQVTRAMKELEELAVDEKDLRDVFKETVQRMRGAGIALGDVGGVIKTVLTKAFGDNRGSELIENVEQHTLAQRPFSVFEQIPEEDLAALLAEEHPQIISVFLAHLDAEKSGRVVAQLSDELRADVVLRIATLGRAAPEVVQRVVEVMRRKVKDLGLSTSSSEPKTWVKKAAHILNNLVGASESEVLEEISGRDEDLAAQIRDEMFTFDDLSKLDKKSMQKVLGSVDTAVLALALKACSPESEQNIFDNLSKRARDMVIDERDTKGPVPLSEVLDAQKQILATVRSLVESGDIHGPGSAGEQLV